MEENDGKDLAQDMKKEAIEIDKYYENISLELTKIRLQNVTIEEKHKQEISEDGNINDTVKYGIYLKFKGEDIKIATLNEEGTLIPNRDILQNEDKKYTDEELEALGDMLNRLGLEQEKVDLNKLQEQLKEIEGKSKEEWEKEKKEKEQDESIKDDDEEKEDEEIDEELENENEEGKEEELAKKMHVRAKDIFLIRESSQFFKNHPQVPQSTFFFKDDDGKIKAREIVNGEIQESRFFKDSTTCLMDDYVNLGNDGENIKRERPWQVMRTEGLNARNTQEIRMAARMEQGYLEFEEIRQGTNGEWTGYGLEKMGRDYNSKVVDKLSDTRTNKVEPASISNRFDAVEHTGLADDGVQKQDLLSPKRIIEKFIDENYSREDATKIYGYMVGEEHLSEEEAKIKVNEEIEERLEVNSREVEDNEKTPWGDAMGRRNRY